MNDDEVAFDLVIPTIGRSSLATLLGALDRDAGRLPERVILVDDRARPASSLPLPALSGAFRSRIEVVSSGGRGPAAARNVGWRAGSSPWVAFVDDDVVPLEGWLAALERDLRSAAPDVAGSQGELSVPLPTDRRPTDWERNVAALETGRWITADMAYRRPALEDAGGFDERFRRAYREDTDLAERVLALGWRLERGRRAVVHPVRPADAFVSLRLQRGNADDVLMTALHPGYRDGPTTFGKRPWHAVTVAAFAGGVLALASRSPVAAGVLLAGWAGLTGALAWRRIAPGPRTPREIWTMLVTSIAMPFVACTWWLVGVVRLPRSLADGARAPRPSAPAAAAAASTVGAAS